MTKTSEKIVFFGSGPVAAASLKLLTNDFDIEAVVTKPKPEHHRGSFPVIELAEELGLKTLFARNKAELDELFEGKPVQSRVAVLIDFGIIISQAVIDYFPLGIINSHFSLLPEWRGADPITFSILSGQKRTGVSLMLLVEAMDEGPLLAQTPYDLPADITTPELTEDLIKLSYESLKTMLPMYLNGEIEPGPQETVTLADSTKPTYSRKLTKDNGLLDWSKPAEQLEREVRAFAEWPKSRTTLAGKEVIVTKAKVLVNIEDAKPGDVAKLESQLVVQASQGALAIERLKPAGKGEMTAQEFLRGYGQKI